GIKFTFIHCVHITMYWDCPADFNSYHNLLRNYNFGGYPIEQNTYAYILGVLGVGGYRDEQQHTAG
ncbi:hypothetical protein D1AOALGA4SA_9532, partial [Olavius algarvensis Delta 1 endosymbiont]